MLGNGAVYIPLIYARRFLKSEPIKHKLSEKI